MATIEQRRNKDGEVTSYRVRACVGRDEAYKQVWRTCTFKRPEGLTPARERKEIERQADAWEEAQKEEYKRSHSTDDKERITFADFVRLHWWKDHVNDGEHTPSTIAFYHHMSNDIIDYFGDKKRLTQIDAEAVKRYIGFLRKDARKTAIEYVTVQELSQIKDGCGRFVLSWSAEKDAKAYIVYRHDVGQRTPHRIAETTDTAYTDAPEKVDVKRYSVKARRETVGNPYSASTVQHHYKCLVNILDYARRMHYITANPCADLAMKEKPHRESKKIDFLDGSQAREYLRCLEAEPLYWRSLENVLITTGLRRGEVVGLQWRDISADKLTLTISRNVTIDKDAADKLHIGSTKGKEARTVPLSRRVYALLMQLKAEQAEKYGALMPRAYIFCRDDDPYKPCYPTEPTRWQRKFVKRHDLQNVSPHDLRHTAATLALESGADLKQVQELLGHKDPTTTMQFYAGVSEEQQRRTVDGIEKILTKTNA